MAGAADTKPTVNACLLLLNGGHGVAGILHQYPDWSPVGKVFSENRASYLPIARHFYTYLEHFCFAGELLAVISAVSYYNEHETTAPLTAHSGRELLHAACQCDVPLIRMQLCAFLFSVFSEKMRNCADFGSDKWDGSPFHAAARTGNLMLLRLFTVNGVDTTALNTAGENGVVLFLRTQTKKGMPYALVTLEDELYLSKQIALTCCPPAVAPDATFGRGETILHVLLRSSSSLGGLVKFALQLGVDPSVHDVDGNTVLHRLCVAGKRADVSLVQLVLHDARCVATINTVNRAGNTALHECVARCVHKLISLLLAKGATFATLNAAGRSPLFYAEPNAIFWKKYMGRLDVRYTLSSCEPDFLGHFCTWYKRVLPFIRLLLAKGCGDLWGNHGEFQMVSDGEGGIRQHINHRHIRQLISNVEQFRRGFSMLPDWRPRRHTGFPRTWRAGVRALYVLARARKRDTEPDESADAQGRIVGGASRQHRYCYKAAQLHSLPEELLQYIVCFVMQAPFCVAVSEHALENAEVYEAAYR